MNRHVAEVDDSTFAALEFPVVIERIARQSTCEPGAAAVRGLVPRLGDREWAHEEQTLVGDAVAFLQRGGAFGFSGVSDIAPMLANAVKGASLSAVQLRSIVGAETALRSATQALLAERQPADALRRVARTRRNSDRLVQSLEQAIDPEGTVKDGASHALAAIRRQQRTLHEQVRERCRSIIHNAELAKMLSEPIVTVRAGRYVVPVRSEFAGQFPGVAHDQSASGATVFIEPLASVEANNRLRALEAEEEREVARILAQLSALVAADAAGLQHNAELVARFDSLGARARWSQGVQAIAPAFGDTPALRIVGGRHPLLRHAAVPLDIELGEAWDAIVISGPNMGGKTVVLKTVGLFCLLAFAGIPLPASAGTVIGGFPRIDCIIGDEQSIAEDLSSFSAHLRALKNATEHAGHGSLVLVDEIGSGTEPGAGAALAQACIEAMIRAGAKVIVSTHYTQLKTFAAAHDRVRNASMLFDAATNAPTFVFVLGVPGQSLAFSLASAIALDPRIIARAETLLGVDAQNLERTFQQLANERAELRDQQSALDAAQRRVSRVEEGAREKAEALQQERLAFEKRAAAALEKAVADLRAELAQRAQQRADISQKQSRKPVADSERLLAQTLGEMRRSLGLERPTVGGKPATLSPGDSVYVRRFERNGVVNELYGDDVLVAMGTLKALVPFGEVVPLGGKNVEAAAAAPSSSGGAAIAGLATEATTQVDVRGMRVDEAWPLIDKALDNAALTGLAELRVLHGKGTGRLSRGLREFLSGHPQVSSLADAGAREGGSGVTIVRLK